MKKKDKNFTIVDGDFVEKMQQPVALEDFVIKPELTKETLDKITQNLTRKHSERASIVMQLYNTMYHSNTTPLNYSDNEQVNLFTILFNMADNFYSVLDSRFTTDLSDTLDQHNTNQVTNVNPDTVQ